MENKGINKETAIEIDSGKDVNNAVSIWLMEKYGADEDFFVTSDQFVDDPKTKVRYKVLSLELPNETYPQIWFKIV